MIHVLLGLKDKEGNISARAFTSVDAPQLVNFQYSLLNICIIWKSLIDIMQIFKRLYYFFYCLLGRIQSTLLHAEKTSLSIYKGSECWFLCLLYTFCPHILNSDFWVFPQSGRIVAIEGSNMLILWSPQTFSFYQNQDEELPRLTQSRLEKMTYHLLLQARTFVFFKYFISSTHRLVWTGLLWWRSVLHFSELRLPARVLHWTGPLHSPTNTDTHN